MADTVNILQNAENVEVSPTFNTYSKVVLNVDDETQASAGTDSGRTLELDNPLFGSQTVATKLLTRLRGFQYQPYEATGALLDPAAEIGDAISANNVFGGIYTRDRTFGRLMEADVSAPHDEEINNEYKYEAPAERKLKREMGDVRATFLIQANQIAAKVSETGGNNSSFGWALNSTSHTWYSGSQQVMKVDRNGLEVNGVVKATGGYIGNETNGFTISARAIYNGMNSLSSRNNGIYIGTDGISLGGGKFKVTSNGTLTAQSATLTGTLRIGSSTIDANALRSGAQSAYTNGETWTSGADAGQSAQATWNSAQNANVGISLLRASRLICTYLTLGSHNLGVSTLSYTDGSGNVRSATFVLAQ